MAFNWNDYYFPNEMMEQADAIENCMRLLKDQLAKVAAVGKNVKRVYIVGSGDCYFIGFAAAHAFRKLCGIEATGYEAYDFFLMEPIVDEETMVVLFSSSGKSLYVLKSLEYVNSKNGIVVGVTNHEDSPLGTDCTVPLVTTATGVSKSFPTKTSTSGLALMYALAAFMGKEKGVNTEACDALLDELENKVPAAIRRIYDEEYPRIRANIKMFHEARIYEFAGSGPCRSAAMIGAAKIIETNHRHMMNSNAEEYMHLIGFSIKSSDAVIVVGNNINDHREIQVTQYAVDQHARVLVIGNVNCIEHPNVLKVAPFLGELSEYSAVIGAMVVSHLFAAELSRTSYCDPDAPHHVDLKHVINLLYTGPVAGWQVEE